MDADIRGCLLNFNIAWKSFYHKDTPMKREEVKAVLQYGLSKGYTLVSQLSDEEVDSVIDGLNKN